MDQEYNLIEEKQQNIISKYYFDITDVLNRTGIYYLTKENDCYQKVKEQLTSIITGFVTREYDEKFYNSLNIFEKYGFLSNSKYREHCKKLGIANGLTSLITETAFNEVPVIIDYFIKKNMINNLLEFIIGWLAYINGKNTIVIQKRIYEYYKSLGIKFDKDKYADKFEKYKNNPNYLPTINNLSESEQYKLFIYILSASDLDNKQIQEKCTELGHDYFKYTYENIRDIIEALKNNQYYTCDISLFTSASIIDIFQDLVDSIDHAKQLVFYNIDSTNPEKNININKKIFLDAFNNKKKANVKYNLDIDYDKFMNLSKPIINKILNPDIDLKKTIEILKRYKKMTFDGK